MPEYERTVTVPTPPKDAFSFLADPANLPKYVADMSFARREQGDRLHVAAEVQGRHEEGDARFMVDLERRLLTWGAGRERGYEGSIAVSGANGGSSVHIRVHVEHEQDEAGINRAMDETVSKIEEMLGRGE